MKINIKIPPHCAERIDTHQMTKVSRERCDKKVGQKRATFFKTSGEGPGFRRPKEPIILLHFHSWARLVHSRHVPGFSYRQIVFYVFSIHAFQIDSGWPASFKRVRSVEKETRIYAHHALQFLTGMCLLCNGERYTVCGCNSYWGLHCKIRRYSPNQSFQ